MRQRPIMKSRPGLEPLEARQLLSAGASLASVVGPRAGSRAEALRPADAPAAVGEVPADRAVPTQQSGPGRGGSILPLANAPHSVHSLATKPNHGYLVYRITNPNPFNDRLMPPFSHVLVQAVQPVPGQIYNVLYVAVRNGTARTFDASSGFQVRFPGQPYSIPILSGNEQWKPGQEFVFYVLTKKYYPLPNIVTSGFEFNLGGARSVAIPGPSGIFLRLKYKPDTFARTLDWIVAFGPGAEGGKGVKYGLPDTAIYEFLSSKTNRKDFGGYF